MKIPCLKLFFHSSIFLLHIPDMGLERAVLFFSLIDQALEVIIFIPNDVLSSFISI